MKKRIIPAIFLLCVLGMACCNRISTPWGDGDETIFKPHREDFTPDIESTVIEQFDNATEVKKAYILRTDDWFLTEELFDFSQAVTTDIVYVVYGETETINNSMAYSFYKTDEEEKLVWSSSAYPPGDASVPFGFAGLTYERIDSALAGREYEDYIITYDQRMSTVFVWVRGVSGDVILTYPTRPDLLGIKNGGIYTLEEIQLALSAAYSH